MTIPRLLLFVATGTAIAGCAGQSGKPDLGLIYNQAAQNIGDERTPVIVVPGILGSKLEDQRDGQKVWGALEFGAADADTPEGARRIALPMRKGAGLIDLHDDTIPTEVLDNVTVDVGPIQDLTIGAYIDILATLDAGRYRDRDIHYAGAAIAHAEDHYTCFQLPYDWRRDVSEQALALHQQILDAQAAAREGRGLPADAPVKVDIVAHSMGGLVLRYYLRYGPTPLDDDGTIPELTWAGAENVDQAVLIGTPSAGSALSLKQLVRGWDLGPIFTNYRAPILGTMPAIYQLLPRTRHARIVDAETGAPIDVFDLATWKRYEWGLASPDYDRVLSWLIPEASTPEERREIALDHLAKCLARAEQLHLALDVEATPPEGLRLHLFAGDSEQTPDVMGVLPDGRIKVLETAPGDNTVTRASALMDERIGSEWSPGLRTPVPWSRVQFIGADHLGLTRDVAFTDNLLYLLLEEPRP